MTVLALTIFISSALVCFFLLLFVMTVVKGNGGSHERLLPLEPDLPPKQKKGGNPQ